MKFPHIFFNAVLTLILTASCAAQQAYHQLEIIPDFPVTTVGKLRFVDSNDYPGATHYVGLKAPADVTTNFDIELPPAPPAATRCVEMTAAGVIQFASGACPAAGSGHPFLDSSVWVQDSADATKQAQIQASGITTATTRTITLQDLNLTMAGIDVAQTFTATQTFQNIGAAADSTYDIGASGSSFRFRWGFADVWNAEQLEVTNISDVWGVHNRNWSFLQEPAVVGGVLADLIIEDTGGVEIIEIGSSQSGSAFGFLRVKGSVIPWTGAITRHLGSATNGWNNVYLDGSILPETGVTTVDLGSDTTEFDDGWFNDQLFVDGALNIRDAFEDDIATIDSSVNAGGTLRLYDDLAVSKALFFTNTRAGTLELDSTNGTLTAILEGNNRVSGTSGYLQLRNNSGVVNVALGDGNLELLGQSAGSGEGSELIGIIKDLAATMEADNFSISGDGNFYIRPFSGADISCTGVDDAWIGFRTDTDEIQMCRGGAVKKVALL